MWNKCRKTLQNRIEIHVKEIKYKIRLTMMMLQDKTKQNKTKSKLILNFRPSIQNINDWWLWKRKTNALLDLIKHLHDDNIIDNIY